jgi:adenylate kinase family enzyme
MSLDSAQRSQLILLFGGPGAGKGTQARLLSATLGLPHISSGDLLRAEYGAAQNVMAQGDLLPDDVVTRLVLARLEQPDAKRGAVLDGFPRTLGQALELDTWLGRRGAIFAQPYISTFHPRSWSSEWRFGMSDMTIDPT